MADAKAKTTIGDAVTVKLTMAQKVSIIQALQTAVKKNRKNGVRLTEDEYLDILTEGAYGKPYRTATPEEQTTINVTAHQMMMAGAVTRIEGDMIKVGQKVLDFGKEPWR